MTAVSAAIEQATAIERPKVRAAELMAWAASSSACSRDARSAMARSSSSVLVLVMAGSFLVRPVRVGRS